MTPLFELERVTASRGDRPVLRGLDLRLERGSTAILGESGSGKSTLLRLLNRLADPDEGRILFQGTDIRELDPIELRPRACLVPQLPAPFEGTVADNVSYACGLRGRGADVERCLGLAGLDAEYTSREAARLSVGEQQRVMLARALAVEPEVLLLDEPTAALDESARDAVERALQGLDVSMVFVTHDPGQAERLASRVVRLRDGRAE